MTELSGLLRDSSRVAVTIDTPLRARKQRLAPTVAAVEPGRRLM